jgi:hypothetical protein
MRTAFRPRAEKETSRTFWTAMKTAKGGRIQSRGALLMPRMLQSSEASTLRSNARDGERYPDVVPHP